MNTIGRLPEFFEVKGHADYFEMQPCRERENGTIEVCPIDKAEFWSVYARVKDGKIYIAQCVANLATQEQATNLNNLLNCEPESTSERNHLKSYNEELFNENSHLKCENDSLIEFKQINTELVAALKAIVDAEEIDLYIGDEWDNATKAIAKSKRLTDES